MLVRNAASPSSRNRHAVPAVEDLADAARVRRRLRSSAVRSARVSWRWRREARDQQDQRQRARGERDAPAVVAEVGEGEQDHREREPETEREPEHRERERACALGRLLDRGEAGDHQHRVARSARVKSCAPVNTSKRRRDRGRRAFAIAARREAREEQSAAPEAVGERARDEATRARRPVRSRARSRGRRRTGGRCR